MSPTGRTPVVVVAAAFAVFFCVTVVVIYHSPQQISTLRTSAGAFERNVINFKSSKKSSSSYGDVDYEYYFTLARENYDTLPYFGTSRDEVVKYTVLDNYNAVIEPYAEMELIVQDTAKRSVFMSLVDTFTYDICTTDDTVICYTGSYDVSSGKTTKTASVPCAAYDELTVTITGYSKENDEIVSASATALCLYVRREIQSLTESDLEETMDAMYTLWHVDEETGQKSYGQYYHSAEYYTQAHHFNAAQKESDHIHEGVGFIAQHIKISNAFEKSMQSVNPKVTLPYWDFTRDAMKGLSLFDTPVFSETMFGTIVAPSDTKWGFRYSADDMNDVYIPDGRWAKLKALKNTYADFENLGNPFGYLRGPWNLNPSPYVSRFAIAAPPLPTCDAYYEGLTMSEYSLFLQWAPFDPHAPIHGGAGGIFGCDKLDQLRDMGLINDEQAQRTICAEWGFTIKDLYRGNYITPKSDCSYSKLTEEGISCGFECNADSYDEIPRKLSNLIQGVQGRLDLSTEQWETWREFLCEGDGYKVFVGDHLESASTYDPSFWPMHPTLERLVQFKFMGRMMDSWSWPTEAKNTCDKANCVMEGVFGNYDQCCYGHYEGDQMLDFTAGNTNSYVGPTNGQTMLDTDPTADTYSMPYIYEHFNWDHCTQDFKSFVSIASEVNSMRR
jgi:hypothetical protein